MLFWFLLVSMGCSSVDFPVFYPADGGSSTSIIICFFHSDEYRHTHINSNTSAYTYCCSSTSTSPQGAGKI
jgi:hypothetical protein